MIHMLGMFYQYAHNKIKGLDVKPQQVPYVLTARQSVPTMEDSRRRTRDLSAEV